MVESVMNFTRGHYDAWGLLVGILRHQVPTFRFSGLISGLCDMSARKLDKEK